MGIHGSKLLLCIVLWLIPLQVQAWYCYDGQCFPDHEMCVDNRHIMMVYGGYSPETQCHYRRIAYDMSYMDFANNVRHETFETLTQCEDNIVYLGLHRREQHTRAISMCEEVEIIH